MLYPDFSVAVGAADDQFWTTSGGAMGGLKLKDVPITVANTVMEKAPSAEIAYINKIYSGNSVYYEISFKNESRFPKLVIAEDGSVVNRLR